MKKSIVFIKIAGVGMLPTALLARELGFSIIGFEDSIYPPASDILQKENIHPKPLSSCSDEDLINAEYIIVGNSLPKDHPLSTKLLKFKKKLLSFPRFLKNFIFSNREVIGIAGTHGKSSSSFFMVQILEQLGFNPGYLIGAQLPERPSAKLGTDFFIIECDEYDSAFFEKIPKIRIYEPDHLLLTSLEFDHADIFNNLEEIENHFKQLSCSGIIMQHNELRKKNLFENSFFYELAKSKSNLGFHYEENIQGCISLLEKMNLKVDINLNNLVLPAKREEYLGKYKKLSIINDFAHHPTAIRKTLQSFMKRFAGPYFVVYCPESFTSRSNLFLEEYIKIFQTEFHLNSLLFVKNKSLNSSLEFATLRKNIPNAQLADTLDEILSYIENISQEDGSLLIMDNRNCYGLWSNSSFTKSLRK